MATLPSGVLTFVFTDIEGSTRLLRELGDGYDDVASLHDALLREVWQAHGVVEVATEGDAFFLVADDATPAVAAAAAAQRAIAEATWPHGVSLRIRIGVHTGYAVPSGDNYRALAVHRASRIVDAANGGQTLLTSDVVTRLGVVPMAQWRSLGRFQVRDFDEPIELWALDAEGTVTDPRPPRVRPADRHNLVRPTTSLVGRDGDIARVADLLRPASVVTLVGPGGIGKTRLAVETALADLDRWDGGAWFVDLSPVIDDALVAHAVAAALGVTVDPERTVAESVTNHLADRPALVVLDNCEQVVAGAAGWVSETSARCPGVAVLATSRLPLGLRGEHVERLVQLDTEPGGAASALYRERAAAVGADGSPEDIAMLCAELDGIPLAIEMAAARAGALTPAEMVRQLRRSPAVLSSRDPTLPDRQRSLVRLFEWSHDLLDASSQRLLALLTAVTGDFDLETVEHLASGELAHDAAVASMLNLVDASFVRVEAAAGATRFRLFDTVRRIASDRLDDSQRDGVTVRFARVLEGRVGPDRAFDPGWMSVVGQELDNVRGVLDRLGERRLDDDLAYRLACTLGGFHDRSDSFRTGADETRRVLDRVDARTASRVGLLSVHADLLLRVGDLDAAADVLAEASAIAEVAGRPAWDEGCVERSWTELWVRRGDPRHAAAVAEAVLQQPLPDRSTFRILSCLGVARYSIGDVDGALDALAREARIGERLGLDGPLAVTYGNLATALVAHGDIEGSARAQERSLTISRSEGMPVGTAMSLIVAGQLAAMRGHAHRALVLRTAGRCLLDELAYVMYPEDLARFDDEDRELRSVLSDSEYSAAVSEATALDADDAADLAASTLADLAGSRAGAA